MPPETPSLSIPIAPEEARQGLCGLEREALRVTPAGRIAQTPHPEALGSTLTHPQITTDFSEALPEFVTAPHPRPEETLAELAATEAFAARHIGAELLWMTSMPCFLDDPATIPIAAYGRSNSGRMKELYRVGLSHRYGRAMQAIAGIHYNYSFPEALWEPLLAGRGGADTRAARDAAWMGLVRNVQRYGWLLAWLFGASPAVCPSFTRQPPPWLKPLANGTLAGRHATSLRLSDIGYKNRSQAALHVGTNTLADYIADLTRALVTEEPTYAQIGVRRGGEWRQLSTAILQIENEYYGLVRPKNLSGRGERPTLTLANDGIRYVEIRAFDIDPATPHGIRLETMYFTELFLWYCLLAASAPFSSGEHLGIDSNVRNVAVSGRSPGLRLSRNGACTTLAEWARELAEAMAPIAEQLDRGLASSPYATALKHVLATIKHPGQTPSARILEEIAGHPQGFMGWALETTRRHNEALRATPLDVAAQAHFAAAARDSLRKQAQLEAANHESFEAYLKRYYRGIPVAGWPL